MTRFILFVIFLSILSCKTTETSTDQLEPTVDTISETETIRPSDLEEIISLEKEEVKLSPTKELFPSPAPDYPAPVRVASEGSMMIKESRLDSYSSEKRETLPKRESSTLNPGPGQITAAEWNDLNHWKDWKELLKNKDYNEMQGFWTLYPRSRYSVFVWDKFEMPVQDARVELLNQKGDIIWKARTDNGGKAELWLGLNNSEISFDAVDIRIIAKGKSKTVKDAKSIDQGVNVVSLDIDCNAGSNVDIMFVVDATGSMGDEISFLQSELNDVIKRVTKSNAKLNLRLGSVFYRDRGDDYLTQVQALSKDHDGVVDFIGAQSAAGGGDYPEAVEAGLDEALAQDWSENAVARILFLLLDAPPHQEEEILQKLHGQIKDAAAEGIKIIPITASGINRQTEFLMKFMSMATNGTYVFITDHSGIGNPHLDPVVQDYEVEKLNDLLVRLIYHYSKSNGCAASQNSNPGISMFPNPTSNYITLKTNKVLDEVKVVSNSGMLMKSEKKIQAGEKRIDLGDLVDGVYTVVCRYGDEEYSQSIIVVSG